MQLTVLSNSSRRRSTRLAVVLAALVALAATPGAAAATAAPEPRPAVACIGLQCEAPSSASFVPEAQGNLPAVADLAELAQQPTAGFYTMPALVYQGATQPQAVVYLAKAGQSDRMPASVRNLTIVRHAAEARALGANDATFVVVDQGIRVILADKPLTARHIMSPTHPCSPPNDDKYFCLYESPTFFGATAQWYGPTYTGLGWLNFGINFGSSQRNTRDGDTLLSDSAGGGGTRYCAKENSEDSTFSNNPIGNGTASAVALLPASDNRC